MEYTKKGSVMLNVKKMQNKLRKVMKKLKDDENSQQEASNIKSKVVRQNRKLGEGNKERKKEIQKLIMNELYGRM